MSNVVYRVTWVYLAKEDFYVADLYKDTFLPPPQQGSFVDYNSLTSEMIMGWVASVENMQLLQAQVTQLLEETKNPATVEKAVPWDKTSQYAGNEKYVITNVGVVVHGPQAWNSSSFNAALIPYGFDNPLPADAIAYRQGIVPISQPLNLSEQVKIYQAIINNPPAFDTNFYKTADVQWSLATGKAIGDYKIVQLSVPEIKSNLHAAVMNKEVQLSTTLKTVTIGQQQFTVLPNQWQTNDLVAKMVMMSDTDITNWYEGTTIIQVSRAILAQLLVYVNQQVDVIYTYRATKTKEIDDCTTFEQLKAIVI
jgi:hypothetical protein